MLLSPSQRASAVTVILEATLLALLVLERDERNRYLIADGAGVLLLSCRLHQCLLTKEVVVHYMRDDNTSRNTIICASIAF